jgi:hypothetical protein
MQMRLWALLIGLAGCSGVFGDPAGGELVTYGSRPTWLAISGNELYYVSSAVGSQAIVMRVSKFPGGSAELVAAGDVITAITADEHGVYWLETSGGTTRMRAWSQGDSAPRELGTNPSFANGSTLRNMVSDADYVYYADYTGTLWRVAKTGTGFVEVGKTDTSAGTVAIGANGDVWVSSRYGAKVFHTDNTFAFENFEVELQEGSPNSMAFSDGRLFLSASGSGAEDGFIVTRAVGETQTSYLAGSLVLPNDLHASGGQLFFITGNMDAAVRVLPYQGEHVDAEPIAAGHGPASLVLDDSFVYWTDPYPGEIRRSPRAP